MRKRARESHFSGTAPDLAATLLANMEQVTKNPAKFALL